MKRINVSFIRIFLIAVLGFLLLMVILALVMDSGNQAPDVYLREPSFAPAEYAYPEFFTEQDLKGGYSWKLTDDNTITIKDSDDRVFHITSDGAVYEEKADGGLKLVEAGEEKNRVIDAALEAAGTSDAASLFLGDLKVLEGQKITTDEEVQKLVGDKMSGEDFRTLEETGLKKEEIKAIADAGFTAEEVTKILEKGISPEEVLPALEKQADIDRRLESTIAGTGISLEELKDVIASAGLSEEDYLRGVEKAKTEERKVETPKTAVTATKEAKEEAPPISVNLMGSVSPSSSSEGISGSGNASYMGTVFNASDLASAMATATKTDTSTEYDKQNGQAAKNDFASSYSQNTGSSYLTNHDISSGTIISMVLITGLNSDLPGLITAEVTQNVYDTLTGKTLLIPKGTKLVATYDSSVSWGQKRALVVWTELIRPDGFVLKLPGLKGVDAAGYSGYSDKVDNHVWTIIETAFLASVLDLWSNEVIYQADSLDMGNYSDAVGAFTNTLDSAGQQYLKKQLNVQPTIRIRPGRTVKLIVNQTLTLDPYRR